MLSADEISGVCQWSNALAAGSTHTFTLWNGNYMYLCASTVKGHKCKRCEQYALLTSHQGST